MKATPTKLKSTSAATKTKTAPKPASLSRNSSAQQQSQEELVRLAAYLRAERRGFAPGYELADWLAAEAEVGSRA